MRGNTPSTLPRNLPTPSTTVSTRGSMSTLGTGSTSAPFHRSSILRTHNLPTPSVSMSTRGSGTIPATARRTSNRAVRTIPIPSSTIPSHPSSTRPAAAPDTTITRRPTRSHTAGTISEPRLMPPPPRLLSEPLRASPPPLHQFKNPSLGRRILNAITGSESPKPQPRRSIRQETQRSCASTSVPASRTSTSRPTTKRVKRTTSPTPTPGEKLWPLHGLIDHKIEHNILKYLVNWKDGWKPTWEPLEYVSDYVERYTQHLQKYDREKYEQHQRDVQLAEQIKLTHRAKKRARRKR